MNQIYFAIINGFKTHRGNLYTYLLLLLILIFFMYGHIRSGIGNFPNIYMHSMFTNYRYKENTNIFLNNQLSS